MGNVAIIGAGITGLTAAGVLSAGGAGVAVFEASERPGGVIRTITERGFLAEGGPNSILLTSPVIMQTVRGLGLEGRVVAPGAVAKKRFIVRGGRPVAMPLSPGGFITTPLFSAGAKLGLLREPFISRAPADAEESLAEFVRRRLGREFLDYAINPFVAGVYAGDPERLSVRHAFPKLHALEQRHGSLILGQILGAKERKRRSEKGKNEAGMISFDTGLQLLGDTMAGRLGSGFRPNTPVASLRPSGRRWEVFAPDRTSLGLFDAVLYAGTAFGLAGLVVGEAPPILSSLGEVRYPPVTALTLGFRREDVAHPLDGFGALVPEVEPFAILGALFTSSLFPGRAPEGHVTITVFLGGMRRPESAEGETGAVVETALRDLRKLLGVNGEPVFVHRAYHRRAIPQYEVGYGRHLEAIAAAERAHPGFFVAGTFRDGVALGNAIVSGHEAGTRIVSHIAAL